MTTLKGLDVYFHEVDAEGLPDLLLEEVIEVGADHDLRVLYHFHVNVY